MLIDLKRRVVLILFIYFGLLYRQLVMKIIAALLLVAGLAVVWADVTFCPKHCKCSAEGSSGISAVCTKLDPKEQVFQDVVQHLTIVNAANKSFTLSDNIFANMGLWRLESIKIINSSLTDISVKAFQSLSLLFDVNLSDNQLFLIHADTFVNNTNLHRLKLRGNPLQLTQLLQSPHETLLRSPSLTDLDLSSCQLSQILPKTFSQLKNLVFISLSYNYLKTIPNDVFDGLEFLEELDLSYNVISKVDKNAFKMNKEIAVLKLRGNPIEVLNGINAQSMEELDLSECKLRILMKETIEGMPELMSLNLSNNNLEVLSSDAFVVVQELKTVDLSYNKLIGPLPRDLFRYNSDLETLVLTGNKDLGALVEESGFSGNHMPMSRLDLADCGLTTMTPGQLKGMHNLNVLNLSGNSIQELDDKTFAHLTQLNSLDLSNNKLTVLGSQLFENNNGLVKLYLSGNPIKHLSTATFASLLSLKYLYANNCQLEHLWDSHKYDSDSAAVRKTKVLPSLTVFDISENRLVNLHVNDFDGMEHLEAIGLAGNPLDCTKTTFQVIDFFDKNGVDPHRKELGYSASTSEDEASLRWAELVDSICPLKFPMPTARQRVPPRMPVAPRKEIIPVPSDQPPIIHEPFPITKIEIEANDSSIMWPMVLAVSILIVALYFIIYLVGEITHRRRAIPPSYARAASLGGHVRTRGTSGSPLYYKLYEECSIPAQPNKEKKNYILDFSPIHTILKKNTYKVMKSNNEANV